MTTSLKSEGAQSIARAALLLRTLSTFGSQGASLMQISTLTQLPKATVHRILSAMLEEHLTRRPPTSTLYPSSTFSRAGSVRGEPGSGNFGSIRSGALEDSNVDLTAELVNMMTARRAYQAN
eukprot:gene34900-57758_t